MIAVVATTVAATQCRAALVAHYKFDDEVGTTALDSATADGSQDAVTNQGTIGWLQFDEGLIGGALDLDGASSLQAPDALGAGATALTISGWINVDATAGYKGVFSLRPTNWGLNVEGGGASDYHADLRIANTGGGSQGIDSPNASIVAGQWHHLAITWTTDGVTSTGTGYLDGASVGSTTSGATAYDGANDMWNIGDDPCCGGREINAQIDDIAVFDTAMDAAGILQIYNWGLAGKDAIGNDAPAPRVPGDVDGNGVANMVDFGIIRDNFYEAATTREEGDLNRDGIVDFDDFDAWKSAPQGASPAAGIVPEPAAAALLLSGLAGLCAARRRGRPAVRNLAGCIVKSAVLAVLLFGGLSQAEAQTPVAHWKFDDGVAANTVATTAVDSVAGNDATWLDPTGDGLSWSTAGQIGGAAVLDGANGALRAFEVPELTPIDFATALSISLWFNPSAEGQAGDAYKGLAMTRTLEDSGGLNKNWGVAWENASNIDNRNGGSFGGANSDNTITMTDTWYHVVAIWDGDEDNFGANPSKDIYVNGVQNLQSGNETMSSVTDIFDSGTWFIGKDTANPNRNFRGMIDDVAFFTEVLTPGQISTIYNNGLNNIDVTGAAGPVFVDGDVTGEGTVDDADFQIIRANFLSSVTMRSEGDLVPDGIVNFDDFRQWKQNAAAAGAATVVPEPGASLLLACAAICGLGLQRRLA